MLIDTHAHLNFNFYKNDADEVIRRSLNQNIWIINVGTNYYTSKMAIEIAEKYQKDVYAAVGLHPININISNLKTPRPKAGLVRGRQNLEDITEEDFDYDRYKELVRSRKVVAIGETGLDYYYKPKTKTKLKLFKEKQRTVLCQQLNLARELNLPVIFHCRFAHDDLIEILKFQISNFKFQGVIHCFTDRWKQAEKYLEMGFYLGFNGIIFKLNLDEIIQKTPLDRILIETDCPYLTPPQESGRNEPFYIKYVAEKIAKVKNLSYEEIAEITTQNAKKLFQLF